MREDREAKRTRAREVGSESKSDRKTRESEKITNEVKKVNQEKQKVAPFSRGRSLRWQKMANCSRSAATRYCTANVQVEIIKEHQLD